VLLPQSERFKLGNFPNVKSEQAVLKEVDSKIQNTIPEIPSLHSSVSPCQTSNIGILSIQMSGNWFIAARITRVKTSVV
jgi:hypothetical protein